MSETAVRTLNEAYEDLSPYIGEITPDHIETFQRDGVVHVPGFVKPELCERVIEHFMDWSGLKWREWPSDPVEQAAFVAAVETANGRDKHHFAARQDDPWMFNYVAQRKFGEAASRLLKAPAVKILSESLYAKHPVASGHSRPAQWHQDFPWLPIDRAQAVQFWLALVPVTVDMGPMVHLKGSHHSEPGGMINGYDEDAETLYPELFERYEVTPLEPVGQGEAVFHHALTWHSSGLNHTNRIRWAMASYRMSANCRYTGQQNFNTDGFGLKPNQLFDHPHFPTVYP